jgi:hypothetical protein
MIACRGRTREISEVEPPELRLRNGLLPLITLGQPVKHDRVEVDIWIHNVPAPFAFAREFLAHRSVSSLIRAKHQPVSLFHEGKLGILVRLTNHNILENREFVASSQRFAERSAKGQGERGLRPKKVALRRFLWITQFVRFSDAWSDRHGRSLC